MKTIYYTTLLLFSLLASCDEGNDGLEEIPVTVHSNVQLTISVDGHVKRTTRPMDTEGFDVSKGSKMEFRSSDVSNGGIAPSGWVDVKTPGTSIRLSVSHQKPATITIVK